MNMSFQNKVALVTGAGSGIGFTASETSARRNPKYGVDWMEKISDGQYRK